MAQSRLQKVLAEAGLASRREAERWIEQGRVTVNGQKATLGQQADPCRDRIEVDGKPLQSVQVKTTYLLYKPAGYVTTVKDPEGRQTVMKFLDGVPGRVFPVGRLDLNTEGLLLVTNDGDLAQKLMHPSHQVEKTYLVKVRGKIDPEAIKKLSGGLRLDDGPTAPAKVEKVRHSRNNSWFELTLQEGRNRQVRRMCQAVGFPVSSLKRVRLGFLTLKGMRPGDVRALTQSEIRRLRREMKV